MKLHVEQGGGALRAGTARCDVLIVLSCIAYQFLLRDGIRILLQFVCDLSIHTPWICCYMSCSQRGSVDLFQWECSPSDTKVDNAANWDKSAQSQRSRRCDDKWDESSGAVCLNDIHPICATTRM